MPWSLLTNHHLYTGETPVVPMAGTAMPLPSDGAQICTELLKKELAVGNEAYGLVGAPVG